jgi:hypothetical protein
MGYMTMNVRWWNSLTQESALLAQALPFALIYSTICSYNEQAMKRNEIKLGMKDKELENGSFYFGGRHRPRKLRSLSWIFSVTGDSIFRMFYQHENFRKI